MTTTAEVPEVAPVRRLDSSFSRDWRGVKIVWRRDVIRYFSDRARIVIAFVQPILLLFILGTGLNRITSGAKTGGVDLRTFMFPGVLAMTVLFTSFFSAGSIVWDREFGFMREMMVAPIHRWSIVVGKCLGGATVAVFQGCIFLLLMPLVHIPYNPVLILTLIVEMTVFAVALTAFGVMISARITQFQTFMAMVNVVLMPMYFMSGALFPLAGLPVWLLWLTRINPMTYAVDPLRHAVFSHLNISATARAELNPGIHWAGWRLPTIVELGIITLLGIAMMGIAVLQFRKAE